MRHNTNTITVKAMAPYFVKLILTGTNRSMHLTFWHSEGSWWHYWQGEKCVYVKLQNTFSGGSKWKTSYC